MALKITTVMKLNVINRELIRGAILGRVDVVAWTRSTSSPWHARGQYGIYTRSPVRFPEPIPYRGQQGLFDVPAAVLEQAGITL